MRKNHELVLQKAKNQQKKNEQKLKTIEIKIKITNELTPMRKCNHMGPFILLWTMGITALENKNILLKSEYVKYTKTSNLHGQKIQCNDAII